MGSMQFQLDGDLSKLSDLKITCVLGFTHVTKRKKFIGKNAKKDVHGDLASENVVRIYTQEGLHGVGFGNFRSYRLMP